MDNELIVDTNTNPPVLFCVLCQVQLEGMFKIINNEGVAILVIYVSPHLCVTDKNEPNH